jgi:hypothetical protein
MSGTPQRIPVALADLTPAEIATWQAVQCHTITSVERVLTLVRAMEHVVRHSIPGNLTVPSTRFRFVSANSNWVRA